VADVRTTKNGNTAAISAVVYVHDVIEDLKLLIAANADTPLADVAEAVLPKVLMARYELTKTRPDETAAVGKSGRRSTLSKRGMRRGGRVRSNEVQSK